MTTAELEDAKAEFDEWQAYLAKHDELEALRTKYQPYADEKISIQIFFSSDGEGQADQYLLDPDLGIDTWKAMVDLLLYLDATKDIQKDEFDAAPGTVS